MTAFFSFGRLGALLMKEFIQMRRDRITFAMMLGVPLMQLVLFGFAINSDPKSLPAALVTTANDPYTRAMVSALQMTGYYRFDHLAGTAAEGEALLASGKVAFVVTIPSDFARRVVRRDNPQILIEADATDPAVASGAISTLGTVAAQALLRELGTEALAAERQRGERQQRQAGEQTQAPAHGQATTARLASLTPNSAPGERPEKKDSSFFFASSAISGGGWTIFTVQPAGAPSIVTAPALSYSKETK